MDVLAWHPGGQAVLIVEVKSRIVDVHGLLATLDRKRRLATQIAAERGLTPEVVGVWLAIADTRTNRRRLAEHRGTFAAAFPGDGRGLRRWLREPASGRAFLSFLPNSREVHGRSGIRSR